MQKLHETGAPNSRGGVTEYEKCLETGKDQVLCDAKTSPTGVTERSFRCLDMVGIYFGKAALKLLVKDQNLNKK